LIEIGNERTFESGARRAASALGTVATLLILIWLVRGILSLSTYSTELLVVSFGLIFLGRALRTTTSMGATRAVSSFFWNIAVASIIILVFIWFLGWIAGIQQDVLPVRITQQVPNLVIVAIATGLAAYAARELAPMVKGPLASGPAVMVTPSSSLNFGSVRLSTKKDSIVLPIRRSRRTVGGVVFGDVSATFQTPMGTVTGSIPGPVTSMGIPFRGQKADKEDVSRLTGKSLTQLVEDTLVDISLPRSDDFVGGIDAFFGDRSLTRMPFVRVRRGEDGESVDVGPISIRRGRGEDEEVRVDPSSFNSEYSDGRFWRRGPFWEDRRGDRGSRRRPRRFSSWWLAKGNRGSSYLSASFDGVQARWNGSSLRLRGDSMKMTVGSDGFTYSPTELETYSPLHTLHVAQSNATLNTKKFTLNVSGSKVNLRSEDGSKSTESSVLAKDLRELLAETANKQVKAVMEGEPMELDDMLVRTEEVLRKYE